MEWKGHYTGIETAQVGSFYAQRDRKTKRLSFLRFRSTGVFLGQTNYVKPTYRGLFEFFTRRWHVGISRKFAKPHISWSGSIMEPWNECMLRFAWFGIGCRTPEFIRKMCRK